MTERDPGAERDPDEGEIPRDQPRREPSLPADEEAAWAAIVAAYGDEPLDNPTDPTDSTDPADPANPADPADSADAAGSGDEAQGKDDASERDGDTLTKPRPAPDDGAGEPPVRSITVYAAGTGPRDWEAPDDDDEGHFVPPEPPPLPETDTTTKFAWVAVLGGPLLLIGAILFQVDLTWWIVTLGVGGFLGGFGTLVARMRDGHDDDWDDPGRGAVV